MTKRQNIRKALLVIMFLLFPIIIFYFSPVLIIAGASRGIAAGSFIVFSLQFVFSIFFGRFTCGYLCPTGGLQECLMMANKKPAKGGKLNLIKYFIWAPWLAVIIFMFIRAGGIAEIDFIFQTKSGISVAEPSAYVIYYGVILLIVILSLAAGRRAFCHYVCWMSPFMVAGTKLGGLLKIPALHMKSDGRKCIACGKCTEICPMSLDVNKMAKSGNFRNSECILCGECADICPKKTIGYSFGKR